MFYKHVLFVCRASHTQGRVEGLNRRTLFAYKLFNVIAPLVAVYAFAYKKLDLLVGLILFPHRTFQDRHPATKLLN